jgi:hypothetical protein
MLEFILIRLEKHKAAQIFILVFSIFKGNFGLKVVLKQFFKILKWCFYVLFVILQQKFCDFKYITNLKVS